MTEPAAGPLDAPPRRRRWLRIAGIVASGAVLLLVAGALFVRFGIHLRYDGPEPVVRVETTALAPDAVATEGVAVSPDGTVYFADGEGYVHRLNADDTTDVAFDLRDVPPAEARASICQLAFAPDGSLYVAHIGKSALHRIDARGERRTLDSDLEGPNFVAWHPAGYVFLTDSTAEVLYRYDPDGGNRTVIADTVSYPNGFAFTPDGRAILLNSCDSGYVYRIPLTEDYRAAGPPEVVRFLGRHVFHKAILDGMLRLPGGDYLVCDFFGNQLLRLREDGTVVQRLVLGDGSDGKPIHPASLAQAPDGAVYVTNLGDVFRQDWGRGIYRFRLPPLP